MNLAPILLLLLLPDFALSAEPPSGLTREVEYRPGVVYRITAKRGYATQVVLASGDEIVDKIGGDVDGWDVAGVPGEDVLYLKPRKAAHNSNLIVRTRRRSYVLSLFMLPDQSKSLGDWMVKFNVPVQPMILTESPEEADERERKQIRGEIASSGTEVEGRNWKYSMQLLPGSEDIVPSEVWDDGRFTFIRIPGNREMPGVFKLTSDGEESVVDRHIDGRDLIVVREVARRWVLRLGRQAVGLWNDAFDANGNASVYGVTSPNVRRVVKGAFDE